ncbi:hypothetical protein [Achromobacter sp. 413638]|uniref:hypothetical protein n=1 Tax=Achromobacter sp. 413638 TaxID=3342385 RepID=UPI00370C9A41
MKFPFVLPFALTRVGWAARQFSGQRADWYEYLADMTQDTQGQRTILAIFEADAQRYGHRSARGILSAHWALRVAETGDMGRTLLGTLPRREVAEFASLQRQGQAVFATGLRDMASLVRLNERLRSLLLSTLLAAVIALAVLWTALMVGVPYLTAPMLHDALPDVPAEYLNPLTRNFFGLAQWLRDNNMALWMSTFIGFCLIGMSFPNLDGRIRQALDSWGPYRLYRDVQAIRVVSTAATALQPRAGKTVSLREVIDLQLAGSSRWLARRLQAMHQRLDDARTGAAVLDVGLLDRETYWYLEDLASTLGLDTALQKTRTRMETTLLKRVESRAQALRWTVLILTVLAMLGLLAWHYGVIWDMRNAMMLDATM